MMAKTVIRKPARSLPSAPPGFDQERFFEGVYWHQRWELFAGIFTPGKNPVELMCQEMNIPDDLIGKRVLDIGAWNGCLSFECERRGAREIIALGPEEPAKTGFYRLRDILGSKRTHYVVGSVYDLNPERLGYFDVVMFCGVLYHLRYPTLGIDNIRRVCTGEVFVETIVNDAQLVEQCEEGPRVVAMVDISPRLLTMPLWQFFRQDELEKDSSNWFTPSTAAVLQAFESAGFEMKLLKNFGRATFQGRVKSGAPEFLTIGSTEGGHYDSITSHLLGKKKLGLLSSAHHHLTSVLASEEFYARSGGDEAVWIRRIYEVLFERSPEPRELAFAARSLAEAYSSHREFLISCLFLSMGPGAPLIAFFYRHLLGRAGTEKEIQNWVEVLSQTSEEQVLAGFLSSEEYFGRRGRKNDRWLEEVTAEILAKPSTDDTTLEALNKGNITRNEAIVRIVADSNYCQQAKGRAAQMVGPSALASEEYYRESGSPEKWIALLYTTVRGRSPDTVELEDALARLHEGYAVQRQALVSDLIRNPEYHRCLVSRFYREHLGRLADSCDVRYWCELLHDGLSEEQMLATFLSSDEYLGRQGKSSARWLEQVHQELLGSKPEALSKKSLSGLQKNAKERQKLILAFVSSPEYKTHLVQRLYREYLGRPASALEMESWTQVLRHQAKEAPLRAA
jgi:tRNA (mo5U34)-methyltransferase